MKKLVKGSKAARDFMARIRGMKKGSKVKKNPRKRKVSTKRRVVAKKNPVRRTHMIVRNPAKRAGYILKIGSREMSVGGISEDEAKALAKKLARMEGVSVQVLEGKA